MQQDFSIETTKVMEIFKLREEHAIMMDGLVITVGIIEMDAHLENMGLISVPRCWN